MRYGTVNYDKRNCTKGHLFLFKQEIILKYFPRIQYIKSTENIAKPPFTRETLQTTKTTFSYKREPEAIKQVISMSLLMHRL